MRLSTRTMEGSLQNTDFDEGVEMGVEIQGISTPNSNVPSSQGSSFGSARKRRRSASSDFMSVMERACDTYCNVAKARLKQTMNTDSPRLERAKAQRQHTTLLLEAGRAVATAQEIVNERFVSAAKRHYDAIENLFMIIWMRLKHILLASGREEEHLAM